MSILTHPCSDYTSIINKLKSIVDDCKAEQITVIDLSGSLSSADLESVLNCNISDSISDKFKFLSASQIMNPYVLIELCADMFHKNTNDVKKTKIRSAFLDIYSSEDKSLRNELCKIGSNFCGINIKHSEDEISFEDSHINAISPKENYTHYKEQFYSLIIQKIAHAVKTGKSQKVIVLDPYDDFDHEFEQKKMAYIRGNEFMFSLEKVHLSDSKDAFKCDEKTFNDALPPLDDSYYELVEEEIVVEEIVEKIDHDFDKELLEGLNIKPKK